MKVCFINPPFKAEFGKFSRESRSPCIGHSGVLYYPLWLIYAAAVVENNGFEIAFIDAPAKQLDVQQTLQRVDKEAADAAGAVLAKDELLSSEENVYLKTKVEEYTKECLENINL